MRIDDIATRRLRVPLDPPLRDSLHEPRCIDWILVEVHAGGHAGLAYMLSFDFAPPVIRAGSAAEALQAARAIQAGGIEVLEVTMTVPGALDAIREIARSTALVAGRARGRDRCYTA